MTYIFIELFCVQPQWDTLSLYAVVGIKIEIVIYILILFMLENNHVSRIAPYGVGPCPRRRVGMCLIGSELIICGGVGYELIN